MVSLRVRSLCVFRKRNRALLQRLLQSGRLRRGHHRGSAGTAARSGSGAARTAALVNNRAGGRNVAGLLTTERIPPAGITAAVGTATREHGHGRNHQRQNQNLLHDILLTNKWGWMASKRSSLKLLLNMTENRLQAPPGTFHILFISYYTTLFVRVQATKTKFSEIPAATC